MLDDVLKLLKTTVVVKTSLHSGEKSFQGCRSIRPLRGSIRLEVINSNFRGLVHVPTRFSKKRWNMTLRAFRPFLKNLPAARRCLLVKRIFRRRGRGYRELVEMQRRKFT